MTYAHFTVEVGFLGYVKNICRDFLVNNILKLGFFGIKYEPLLDSPPSPHH